MFFGWTVNESRFVKAGEFYMSGSRVFVSGSFWSVLFDGILFCLLPRFLFDVMKKMFFPRDIDIIRECWKKGEFKMYPEGYDPTDPNRKKIVKFMPDLDENDDFERDDVDLFEATTRVPDDNKRKISTNTIKSHFRHLSETVPIINGRQSSVISSPVLEKGNNFESLHKNGIQLDEF